MGPTAGADQVLLINPNCRNLDFPANGECVDGWYYYGNPSGRPFTPDPTVRIDCIGIYHKKLMTFISDKKVFLNPILEWIFNIFYLQIIRHLALMTILF